MEVEVGVVVADDDDEADARGRADRGRDGEPPPPALRFLGEPFAPFPFSLSFAFPGPVSPCCRIGPSVAPEMNCATTGSLDCLIASGVSMAMIFPW